jgi:hypothetical protein
VTHSQGIDLTPKSDEKRLESHRPSMPTSTSPMAPSDIAHPDLGYLRILYKNSGLPSLKSPGKSPDSQQFDTDPDFHPSQARSLPTSPKMTATDSLCLDPSVKSRDSLSPGGQADEADEQEECLKMLAVTPTTDVEVSSRSSGLIA